MTFPSKDDKDSQRRQRFIEFIGADYYNCLLLAQFDPEKADNIYCTKTPETLAKAITSRQAFNYSHG